MKLKKGKKAKMFNILALIREVEVISNKIKKDEEEGGVAGEWKYAAMVMDRFSSQLFLLPVSGFASLCLSPLPYYFL